MGRASTATLISIALLIPTISLAKPRRLVVGADSWVEIVKVQRVDGKNFDARSQVTGLNVGIQFDHMKENWGWSHEYGVAIGTASTQSASSELTFLNRGAPMIGGYFSPGIYKRPDSETVKVGVSLPIILRQVKYDVGSSSHTLNSESRALIFTCIDFDWQMTRRFSLSQRFGGPLFKDGTFWQTYFTAKF